VQGVDSLHLSVDAKSAIAFWASYDRI